MPHIHKTILSTVHIRVWSIRVASYTSTMMTLTPIFVVIVQAYHFTVIDMAYFMTI